jgi:hypothetical protein
MDLHLFIFLRLTKAFRQKLQGEAFAARPAVRLWQLSLKDSYFKQEAFIKWNKAINLSWLQRRSAS